jgi:hypothetical protein
VVPLIFTQLEAIASLAASTGARVVNFLTFNPYFEWERNIEIGFQARHSDITPYLMRAIDICDTAGIEANVRYMPPCQLPGYEPHVYTGFHEQYATRWGGGEVIPYSGPRVTDPRHFIRHQNKTHYLATAPNPTADPPGPTTPPLAAPLRLAASGGATARHNPAAG